jgi:hypothetical protein
MNREAGERRGHARRRAGQRPWRVEPGKVRARFLQERRQSRWRRPQRDIERAGGDDVEIARCRFETGADDGMAAPGRHVRRCDAGVAEAAAHAAKQEFALRSHAARCGDTGVRRPSCTSSARTPRVFDGATALVNARLNCIAAPPPDGRTSGLDQTRPFRHWAEDRLRGAPRQTHGRDGGSGTKCALGNRAGVSPQQYSMRREDAMTEPQAFRLGS